MLLRVAKRYLESKRTLMYHGTSTKYLRNILKEGLLPGTGVNQFEQARDQFGGYGGVYLIEDPKQSLYYARNVVQNKGGDPLIIIAQVEPRSPGVQIDEELLITILQNASAQVGLRGVQPLYMEDRFFLDQGYTHFNDIYRIPGTYSIAVDILVLKVMEKLQEHILEAGGSFTEREKDFLNELLESGHINEVARHYLIYRDMQIMPILLRKAEYSVPIRGPLPEDVGKDHLIMFRQKIKKLVRQIRMETKPYSKEIGVVSEDPLNYRGTNRIVGIVSLKRKGTRITPTIHFERGGVVSQKLKILTQSYRQMIL